MEYELLHGMPVAAVLACSRARARRRQSSRRRQSFAPGRRGVPMAAGKLPPGSTGASGGGQLPLPPALCGRRLWQGRRWLQRAVLACPSLPGCRAVVDFRVALRTVGVPAGSLRFAGAQGGIGAAWSHPGRPVDGTGVRHRGWRPRGVAASCRRRRTRRPRCTHQAAAA